MSEASGVGFIIICGLVLFLYFAPGLIAGFRNHRNTNAIFILNIFLGWTFIGWVAALVWAFMDTEKR